MRLIRGLLAFSLASASSLALASAVSAAPLTVLNAHDADLYEAAFQAADRGDAATADSDLALVSDPALTGKVQFLELTKAKARTASYDELAAWLQANGDMPGADQIYQMAVKRRPADAVTPMPAAPPIAMGDGFRSAPSPQNHAARDAFYSGDVRRGLELARASGDAWIAGMAAWRLGDYADALVSFETLAANPAEDDATRAAGGFWAARAAAASGAPDRAAGFLKIAAASPSTFYGMIAQRKLELAADPLGQLIDTATKPAAMLLSVAFSPLKGERALDQLVRTDPRARRAVALNQIGRPIDAGAELRAAYASAADDGQRAVWMGLMYELNPKPKTGEVVLHAASAPTGAAQTVYPTPPLNPTGGYTVDKALVYAIAWQESRFNALAVSPVGAIGMMQLMPPSAASMAGEPELSHDPITLFDTGKNLALGQTYLNWLEENAAGHDIMRTVAAYNGGPGTLARTQNMVGAGTDTLTLIECVPFSETRAYVKRVMAAYWSYRRQFGASTRTLDAAAAELPTIDARLDSSAPSQNPQAPTTQARQALEILLPRGGG